MRIRWDPIVGMIVLCYLNDGSSILNIGPGIIFFVFVSPIASRDSILILLSFGTHFDWVFVKQHHLLFRNPREKFIHIFDRKQLKKNHLLLDRDRLEYLQQQHVHLLCLFVIFFLFTWRNCCITVTVISHFYFFLFKSV